MSKKILITGATDGIGLEAAKPLVSKGHQVLIHGRNPAKLARVAEGLSKLSKVGAIETFQTDFSKIREVDNLAEAIKERHQSLDVLINNAGVYRSPGPTTTEDGLDIRFAVNTVAPYLLTERLLPLLKDNARVVNLSAAAQASVNIQALLGKEKLLDGSAYAQSKLAITAWSHQLGMRHQRQGPMIVSVNPGSMLATKMVKEAFGVSGADIGIGADILVRSALSDEFASASGQYFDNDSGRFAPPHPEALDPDVGPTIISTIETILKRLLP